MSGDDGGSGSGSGSGSGDVEGLKIDGNHIVYASSGINFHGRGANLHDTRSCSACSFAPADPAGLNRWSDELTDVWHANLVRFLLSAKAAPFNQSEVQWKNLVDDPAYLADIVTNVTHLTAKPGVYVLVTLFADPTIKDNNGDFDSEWPSSLGDSNTRYTALAEALVDDPHVLFGLTNEPHTDTQHEADLATVYEHAITAIRAVEDAHGVAHHIIVAQAPVGYARDVSYFVAHPLSGDQIAYEIHPYDHQVDFMAHITTPSASLPLIIGEYGETPEMSDADITQMWSVAEAAEVPYIAWNFHARCPPNLLQDTSSDGCGLSASTGYDFPRTPYGDLVFAHLQTPW
jgi:Cellulase (glycosyl hydrolase family 5)